MTSGRAGGVYAIRLSIKTGPRDIKDRRSEHPKRRGRKKNSFFIPPNFKQRDNKIKAKTETGVAYNTLWALTESQRVKFLSGEGSKGHVLKVTDAENAFCSEGEGERY